MAYIFYFSSNTIQLSSHNCPSEINEELLNSGSAVAVCAYFDSFDDRDNCPTLIGFIELASGNNIAGPIYGLVFFRQAKSFIRI